MVHQHWSSMVPQYPLKPANTSAQRIFSLTAAAPLKALETIRQTIR